MSDELHEAARWRMVEAYGQLQAQRARPRRPRPRSWEGHPVLRHADDAMLVEQVRARVDDEGMPVERYRVRCPRRHVLGVVVDTYGAYPALVYLTRPTFAEMAETYRREWGVEPPREWDDAVKDSARQVVVAVRPVGRPSSPPAPPAWCGRCERSHDVDTAAMPRTSSGDVVVSGTVSAS